MAPANLATDHELRLHTLGYLLLELAHDLANPINFMKASASALQMNLEEMKTGAAGRNGLLDESLELCAAILEGAERNRRLLATINQFGRPAQHMALIPFHRVIDSSLRLLKHQLSGGIRLKTDLDETIAVAGVEVHLEQLVMNLLVNAVQAVKAKPAPGGERAITLSLKAEEGWACLSVTDSGAGIGDEIREHLFTPFASGKGQKSGSGLGLAIVKRIVDSHSGKIEVVSQVGSGTTFKVCLPVALALQS